jgi:Bacterial surface proteins containing Ig-like domains
MTKRFFHSPLVRQGIILFFFMSACTCTTKNGPEPDGEKDKAVHVTGVKVTRADLELNVGDGFHLGARVTPKNATNARVSWSSDHPEVATVEKESGQVKAVAAGKAVITVTTEDGGFTDTSPRYRKREKERRRIPSPPIRARRRPMAPSRPKDRSPGSARNC